ncbi:MAG: PQQ-like beta-propeller repeat protein, partial [Phycisphaeraceae bacterium]|nr:PQQ-like beta-propeller repeat protein [Phycisphaeraceae bacterium]
SPQLIWSWTPMHAPNPAWPDEPRMWFDTVFYPVIADGILFVASNADDQLRALDAATGEELWTFFADGPIRFAPAVASAEVYFGSDDGYVYCLDAASGVLVWKTLAAPSYDRVMGNGRMISRWPVRGGVAVRDGEVYAAAGFWATDKVYLLALDAKTGQILWRNGEAGEAKVVRKGETGAAFQGYLTVGRESIIAPNGRIGPSVFQRSG